MANAMVANPQSIWIGMDDQRVFIDGKPLDPDSFHDRSSPVHALTPANAFLIGQQLGRLEGFRSGLEMSE